IATLEKTSSAPSPRHPAVAYCQGTPLRNEIETRDANLLDHVTDRAAEAIAARFGDGPVAGKIRAHIVAAAR
ncbi:MAG: SAM-dependent methyltransferase, partial [Alphaproteobacteria bacterium]